MKVLWLRNALQSLDREAEYIAVENPTAAREVVQSVLSSVDNLAENPSLGRPGRVVGTRELIIPKLRYIIPYRVNVRKNRVEILRVFHTSRKTPKKW